MKQVLLIEVSSDVSSQASDFLVTDPMCLGPPVDPITQRRGSSATNLRMASDLFFRLPVSSRDFFLFRNSFQRAMHAALTQRRNLVLIVVLLTLVFSLSFFQHAGYQPSVPQIETPLNDEPVNPSIIEPQPNINQDNQESSSAEQPSTSDEVTSSEPPKTVCDQVDMDWL